MRCRSAAASPVAKAETCSSPGGYSRPSPAATSASPECSATTGGTPADAASAATIPNASGKIEGTAATSQSGSRWARCRCSSGPVKSVPGGASASSVSR